MAPLKGPMVWRFLISEVPLYLNTPTYKPDPENPTPQPTQPNLQTLSESWKTKTLEPYTGGLDSRA